MSSSRSGFGSLSGDDCPSRPPPPRTRPTASPPGTSSPRAVRKYSASQLLNARLGVDVLVDRFADVLKGEVIRVIPEGAFNLDADFLDAEERVSDD